MAQKQTKKAEEGKEPLVCTYGTCKKLQCEDGEFCKTHLGIMAVNYTEKQKKVIDALNELDEWASWSTQDNDNGEAEKQTILYNRVFDFVAKNDNAGRLEAMTTQLSHERQMLKNWKGGDLSCMPKNWSIEKQAMFIKGMKHAIYIFKDFKNYL